MENQYLRFERLKRDAIGVLAVMVGSSSLVGGSGCALGARAGTGPQETNSRTTTTGLPNWPQNPTKFKVLKQWSWDAKAANPNDPKAGSLLPDYGRATAVDVNNHINQVWNACKGLKHIQGEKITDLSKRIQSRVDKVIEGLPYKPTEAERTILRSAGNNTFVVCNFSYGENSESGNPSSILYRNNPISGGKMTNPFNRKFAQALLNLSELRDVCAGITTFELALNDVSNVLSYPLSAVNRYRSTDTAVRSYSDSSRNHRLLYVCIPTRLGSKMTPAERMKDSLHSLTAFYNDPTLGLLNNSDKSNLNSINSYPRPFAFAVGAKGDDVNFIFAACRYGVEDYTGGGYSIFKVKGFGEGSNSNARQLPSEVDTLFKTVQDTRGYMVGRGL